MSQSATTKPKEECITPKNQYVLLIDMIFRVDGGYDAVQSTIGRSHKASAAKIRVLKDGFKLRDDESLRIFFAVPVSRYKEFETAPANPLHDEPDLANVFHLSCRHFRY